DILPHLALRATVSTRLPAEKSAALESSIPFLLTAPRVLGQSLRAGEIPIQRGRLRCVFRSRFLIHESRLCGRPDPSWASSSDSWVDSPLVRVRRGCRPLSLCLEELSISRHLAYGCRTSAGPGTGVGDVTVPFDSLGGL